MLYQYLYEHFQYQVWKCLLYTNTLKYFHQNGASMSLYMPFFISLTRSSILYFLCCINLLHCTFQVTLKMQNTSHYAKRLVILFRLYNAVVLYKYFQHRHSYLTTTFIFYTIRFCLLLTCCFSMDAPNKSRPAYRKMQIRNISTVDSIYR